MILVSPDSEEEKMGGEVDRRVIYAFIYWVYN